MFDYGCIFTRDTPRDDRLPVLRAAILALCAVGAALFPVDPVFELPVLFAGIVFFGLLVAADEIAALPR